MGTCFIGIFFFVAFEVLKLPFIKWKLCDMQLPYKTVDNYIYYVFGKIFMVNILLALFLSLIIPSLYNKKLIITNFLNDDYSWANYTEFEKIILNMDKAVEFNDYGRIMNKILINKGSYEKFKKEVFKNSNINENMLKQFHGIHLIREKYFYSPLTSVFWDVGNLKKRILVEYKDIYPRRSFNKRIYYIMNFIEILIIVLVYFLILKIDDVYFMKYLKFNNEEDKLEWKRHTIKFKVWLLIGMFVVSFFYVFIDGANTKFADIVLITHYSKITDKKLSSLSDKIKKLNIKTDEQLSEAIHEGKISVSNVLDSTLTIQIEDSRLDKNIKKELLDYYRDNYEKYRYRIINGYLIDFIHGKYRKIKPKAIFKASKHRSFFKTVRCSATNRKAYCFRVFGFAVERNFNRKNNISSEELRRRS